MVVVGLCGGGGGGGKGGNLEGVADRIRSGMGEGHWSQEKKGGGRGGEVERGEGWRGRERKLERESE